MNTSTKTIAPSPEGGNHSLSDTPADPDASQIGTADAPPSGVVVKVTEMRSETLRKSRFAFVAGDRAQHLEGMRAATVAARRAFAAAMALAREEIVERVVGESAVDVVDAVKALLGATQELTTYVAHLEHLVSNLDPVDAICVFHQDVASSTKLFGTGQNDAKQLVDMIAWVASKETGEVYDETDYSDVDATPRNRAVARAFMLRRLAELREELAAEASL